MIVVNKLEPLNGNLRWTIECSECQAIQTHHTRGKIEAEMFQARLRNIKCHACGAGPKDQQAEAAEVLFAPDPFMSFRTGMILALVIGLSLIAAAYFSS